MTRIRFRGKEWFYVASSWGASDTTEIGTEFDVEALIEPQNLQMDEYHGGHGAFDILNIADLGAGVDGIIVGFEHPDQNCVSLYKIQPRSNLDFGTMKPAQGICTGD